MSAKPLVIVCAGGYGRETAAAVEGDDHWELLGFADDDPALHGTTIQGIPVIGPPEKMIENGWAVVCQAHPDRQFRRDLVQRIKHAHYASIVHKTAWLASSTTLGPGSVILAGVVATASVTIGSHVAVMPNVVIGHDSVIDDFATLAAGVKIAGGVRIENTAYIGMGALLREGITVGANAKIGMGAVVTRDVPPGETWLGSPARQQQPPE